MAARRPEPQGGFLRRRPRLSIAVRRAADAVGTVPVRPHPNLGSGHGALRNALRQAANRAVRMLLRRLLEQLVDPRLEHVSELLVERVAEIAAGAGRGGLLRIGGGACRLRAGSRAAAAGARLLRGRFRAAAVAGARTRGRARAAAALAAAALAGGRLLLGAPAARGLAGIALGLGFRACLCFLAGRRRARLVVVVVARPGAGRGLDRLGGLFPIPVVGRGALLLLRLVLE